MTGSIPYRDTWTEVLDDEGKPRVPRTYRVRVRCADCGTPVEKYPPYYVTCPNRTEPGWGPCGKPQP
jgi:hypothetical protein